MDSGNALHDSSCKLSKILNRVCYAIKLFVHEGKLRLKTPER